MSNGERVEPGGAQAGRVEWFYSDRADPVFEGMVKDSCDFTDSLEAFQGHLEQWMTHVDEFAGSLRELSLGGVANFAHARVESVVSDVCKLQQAVNQIARLDAPHSAISRLKRNLELNLTAPIKKHLEFAERLGKEIDARGRRLEELRSAKRQVDACTEARVDEADQRFKLAREEFEVSERCFQQVDRHLFEWLYVLEEHRGDMRDSLLQTVKFLQYEFFAQSAHALARTLPARLEFRPMSDMDPSRLEREVERCKREARGRGAGRGLEGLVGASRAQRDAQARAHGAASVAALLSERALERLAEGGAGGADGQAACAVDPLSLSSLLVHGFDEGPARRALRICGNDTQAALELLLAPPQPGAEAVRRPTARRREGGADRGQQRLSEPEPADIGAR